MNNPDKLTLSKSSGGSGSGGQGAVECNNGSTGYFWCDATNECLPPSDHDKCDEAACTAQSGSTGYSWCAATSTCLPPGDTSCTPLLGSSYCTYSPDKECYSSGWPECCGADEESCPDARPGCDTGAYCVFAPDPTCYDGGWPECCQDETKGCPDERPPCDSSQTQAYCVWAPNFDCYAGGWPACCLEDYTGCPSDQPACETTQAPIVGASYCTYAPDAGCYTNGWPECCMNNGGNTCPEEQPECNFQCNRDCSSRGDCQTTGGAWDPGMPWCGGTCANGHCQPVIETCTEDSDCGDRAICGVYGFCVGKTPDVNQCGRNCSGNYECANDGGTWGRVRPGVVPVRMDIVVPHFKIVTVTRIVVTMCRCVVRPFPVGIDSVLESNQYLLREVKDGEIFVFQTMHQVNRKR